MAGLAASGVSQAGSVASGAVAGPPSATPDTRLAVEAARLSIAMTATAQAGRDSQSTLAAVANAANITATAYMYGIAGTREAATQQAMGATQTALPPMQTQDAWSTSVRGTETQSAITQGMIDDAATRVAAEADSYTVRQNAIEHENWRQWIYTGGALVIVLLMVAGVYGLFEMGRLFIQAQADGVKAVDRADAQARLIKANAEAERIYAEIRVRARERELRELAARNVPQERTEVVEDEAPDLIDYEAIDALNQSVVEFIEWCAKAHPQKWQGTTIPTEEQLTAIGLKGGGTRGRITKLLKAAGHIKAEQGRGKTTDLTTFGTLEELHRAFAQGRARVYATALPVELPTAA